MEAKASAIISFLGAPELIVILLAIFLIIFPIVLVLILVKVVSKPKPPSLPPQPSPRERLLELDKLRSENLITDAEHEAGRKSILENI